MPSLIQILRPLASKSAGLSSLYRRLRDELYLRRPPVKTPFGFRFAGPRQMEAGVFEPAETQLVMSLASSVTTLINVGANVGYYCCIGLQAGLKVVAFEPMTMNQRALYRNVMANGWANQFECYPVALSDQAGLIEIWGSGTGASLLTGWSNQTYSSIVPVSTLDTVLGGRFDGEPRLIIVDVEGAELRVLRGAEGSLRAPMRPIWLVEIEMISHQPTGSRINRNFIEIFRLFHDSGYTAFTATVVPRSVMMNEVRESVASGVRTFGTNNFLFVDASRVDDILAGFAAPIR